ncbi:MAG TPA: hypothetical protein PLQ95_06495 [Thiobacillus sp.]|nr:hypothetical protein [Thiobacillus sp.]
MNDKARRRALFAALAGITAWSSWLALDESATEAGNAVVELAEPAARARSADLPAIAPARPQAVAPRLALARTNLFPEQTWFVPPPPPPPPPYVPPPLPQAPPLPFSYMGRWQEAGQTTYYLTRGTASVSVRAGQVLNGVWRLEPVAGGMLNFTYLPLNQMRSLRTGD